MIGTGGDLWGRRYSRHIEVENTTNWALYTPAYNYDKMGKLMINLFWSILASDQHTYLPTILGMLPLTRPSISRI